MTALTFAVVFLGLAFLALCFGFLVLARQIGVLYERIAPMGALMNDSGPQVGEQSPKFTLESLNGGVVSIGTVKETATLVFFVSPTCPICKKLIPILRSIRSSEGDWLTVVLASDGDEDNTNGGGNTGGDDNTAPSLVTLSTINTFEGNAFSYEIGASDAEDDTVTFSISGGADQAEFSINGTSGLLSANAVFDYENPTDADNNNQYELRI